MTESAGTWPEQNAVDAWLEKHGISVDFKQAMELKEAVTAYRLQVQAERDRLLAVAAPAVPSFTQQLALDERQRLIERCNDLQMKLDALTAAPAEQLFDQLTADADCHKCLKGKAPRHMIVCPTCGNKRCPKASDHELACTGSNEPGQSGSVYSGVTIAAKEQSNG